MASTVTGIWHGITFYCKNHPNEKLELKQGAYSAYYGCPHEYDEKQPCHNRLNLIDADKAIQHLQDILSEASKNGNLINLTNYCWNKNGLHFKVLMHNPMNDHFKILVDNKKIMQGTSA